MLSMEQKVLRLAFLVLLSLATVENAAARFDLGLPLSFGAVIRGDKVATEDPVARSSVYIDLGENALCSGTAIARDIVVTAAHCTAEITSLASVYVLFGVSLKSAVKVKVSNYIAKTKKRYNGGDIALLLLGEAIPEGFGPARVLRDSSQLRSGQKVIVAGFGDNVADDDGSEEESGEEYLRPYLPNGNDRLLRGTSKIMGFQGDTEIMLTGTGNSPTGQGACNGDSGGSVYVEKNGRLYAFGVISRGDEYCKKGGIVGRIDAHRDWVDSSIRKLRSGGGEG
jgi:secreted trypsin-like serine protease